MLSDTQALNRVSDDYWKMLVVLVDTYALLNGNARVSLVPENRGKTKEILVVNSTNETFHIFESLYGVVYKHNGESRYIEHGNFPVLLEIIKEIFK